MDTKNLPDWNWDMAKPNNNENNWKADSKSDTVLDNAISYTGTPEHHNLSAVLNVPGVIQSTRK